MIVLPRIIRQLLDSKKQAYQQLVDMPPKMRTNGAGTAHEQLRNGDDGQIAQSMSVTVLIFVACIIVFVFVVCAASNNALNLGLKVLDVTLELGKLPFDTALKLGALLLDTLKSVILEGFFGGISTILSSLNRGCIAVYNDTTIDKLVLLAAVAVMVKHFPWMMDSIVRMLSKPPRG